MEEEEREGLEKDIESRRTVIRGERGGEVSSRGKEDLSKGSEPWKRDDPELFGARTGLPPRQTRGLLLELFLFPALSDPSYLGSRA